MKNVGCKELSTRRAETVVGVDSVIRTEGPFWLTAAVPAIDTAPFDGTMEDIEARKVGIDDISGEDKFAHLLQKLQDKDVVNRGIADRFHSIRRFGNDAVHKIVGDPQTAVSHLGDVVLFLQTTLARFYVSCSVLL